MLGADGHAHFALLFGAQARRMMPSRISLRAAKTALGLGHSSEAIRTRASCMSRVTRRPRRMSFLSDFCVDIGRQSYGAKGARTKALLFFFLRQEARRAAK